MIAGMVAPADQAQGLVLGCRVSDSRVGYSQALNESNAGQLILEKYKAAIFAEQWSISLGQLIAEEQELRDLRFGSGEFVKLAEAFDQKSTQARENTDYANRLLTTS